MIQKFENFDICIIGGSIAGNYLCYLISNTNLKISVIEEHNEIGLPFQCAGIISQKLTTIIDIPDEIILNRVKVAKIITPKGKYIKLSGKESPFIIDRIALDKFFFHKVQNNANITFYLGEKFKSFEYMRENRQKSVLIKTNKRYIKAKMLIGCDGPLTLVGKQLNIKNKLIYATQIRISGNFNENEAVLYFNPKWRELFGWIVPEGNRIYRIGLASSSKVQQKFKQFLKILAINYDKKIDQQGGIIPFGIMNKLTFDHILLLGDAAGQVKATTGGGIIMLLTAAKVASACIRKCFQKNDFSKKFIKKHYEVPCMHSIGKELKIHYLIRLVLQNFSNRDFEAFFTIIKNHHIEKVISLYGDMDFPKDMLIEMTKNPQVIKFLLGFFIKHPTIVFKALKLLK